MDLDTCGSAGVDIEVGPTPVHRCCYLGIISLDMGQEEERNARDMLLAAAASSGPTLRVKEEPFLHPKYVYTKIFKKGENIAWRGPMG